MNTTSGLSKQKAKSSRGRLPDGSPNPIDIHVGNRIRYRRLLLGISQERLAKIIGLTFQQVQKYECGMNRIGASRMWDLSKVLGVPVGFFFEDMPTEVAEQSPRCFVLPDGKLEGIAPIDLEKTDPMNRAETYELVRDYYRINNRQLAKSLKASIHEATKGIISNAEEE